MSNFCKKYILFIAIALCVPKNLFAQEILYVEGAVCDKYTHLPISSANISIENKSEGTTTDDRGKFSLAIKKEFPIVLSFSHIGFYPQSVTLYNTEDIQYLKILLSSKYTVLSDVVVTAGLRVQNRYTLPKSVDLITQKEIAENIYSNMVDMLAHTPGFTQVWEYHSPILLRGLNSKRLIVMQNGSRRIGTFPGGYFGQDMNVYAARKVEIVKGPGSVIYGSGAISGIINVVKEKPFGNNKNGVQLSSGYGSNNNEFLELVKVCHKREKFGILLNGKYRKTGEMVYGNGEVAKNSNVEDRDISLSTGYKFSEKHKVAINANYHYGNWGKPRGFNGATKYFTKIRNKEENFHTDFTYSYTPKGVVESINLNCYYDNGWRDYYQYKHSTVSGNLSTLDLVHYKNSYGGGRLYTVLNVTGNNKLTTGIDGYLFRLDNPSEMFDYYNDTHGEISGVENAGQQNLGVFINDEWKIGEKWQFVSGIRFDAATVVEGKKDTINERNEKREALSGNAGLVYSPNKSTHISLNIGRAFRMPTTEELFTKVISCKGIKIGNPYLQPEYSWNFDVGFRGYALKQKLKYDLALFYNILDGFINEAPSNEPDIDFTLKNTDAKLLGGEFSVAYRFDGVFKDSNTLHLGLGGAYVYGSDLSEGKSTPLFGVPPLKINAELDYRGVIDKGNIANYSLKLDVEYAAKQNRVAAIPEGTQGGPWGYVPSKSHTIFNLHTGVKIANFPGNPELRLVLKNILNTDYYPFGSYIPAMGRNVKVLLTLNF